MPYDPRMQQMIRGGIGMLGPGASPFDRGNQPRQWWDQPPPQPQARPDDSNPSGQPATQPPNPAKPPTLYDMMINLGGMTRPQYDRAIRGQGGPRGPSNAPGYSPWAWLGQVGGMPR